MAQIGEKYYDTLAAAVNAAADGDKATLLKDLDLGNDRITIKKAITLDLNGCKITGTNATNTLWFEAEGITLQDSRGNGKVQNTGTGSNNIAIVVNGATTTAYLKDGIVSGNYAVFVQNGAKAVIDGGKYTGTYGACTVGTNESASKTTLEVNITGGTLTSDNNAAIAIYRLAKVDGQWTTNDNAALKNYLTSLNIKGGHFSGDNRKGAFEVDSVAKDVIHISSGYFTSDPSAYVADGKAALPGTEPGYALTVGDKVTTDVKVEPASGDSVVDVDAIPEASKDTAKAVAEVNGDRYMNLTDALNAAENGNTVTILKAPDANTNFSMSGDTRTIKVKNGTEFNLTVTINGEKHENVKANESFEVKYTCPSSGGGSSSTTYAVNVEKAKHGSVDSNRSRASSGTTVTLTVQPDNGYELDELTVTDKNGNGLKLTKKSDPAQVIFNLEGHQTVNYAMSFGDVKGSEWFAEAVRWAASEKIVSGYDNGNFGPNDPTTREQLAVILFRYAQYKGMDTVTLEENLTGFADADEISGCAVSALNWAVGAGVINGTGAGLAPKANATRSKVAQMLMNFDQNVTK
ncbi:S-layer homology domain-containing protein [bacterium 210917-SL.2.15]|nr:S-layer homology domain-containing protein [bacterium 210917-SL.2.15]